MQKQTRFQKITMLQIRAFSVHIFTASGSFVAFLSLISASEKQWSSVWIWLGIALIIDGLDGPIARYLKVKEVLPTWSGELLDHIIDYVAYVLVPAFVLYQSGFAGVGFSFVAAALIVVTSAIYYADTRMKSEENFFQGFPVVWNMEIFALFVIQPPAWICFSIIVVSALLCFFPVWFVHPIRVKSWRKLTGLFTCIWGGAAMLCVFYYQMEAPLWLRCVFILSSVYLFFIGMILQLVGKIRQKTIKGSINRSKF